MPPIRLIVGPTASGKSARALALAEREDAVIINADSQQTYRELRILTARPSAEDERRYPHRLYGMWCGENPCSAGQWLERARMEIDWALAEGKTPIVVGGTGLYLKALLEGIGEIPSIEPSVRAQSKSDFEHMGKAAFANRLREVDAPFFERLKVQDPQRLIRAYEVWLGTGKPLSYWQSRPVTPPYARDRFAVERLSPSREMLYANCNARVLQMLQEGAVEEVRNLLAATGGETPSLPLAAIIGVRELTAYLRGDITLDEATGTIQQATRRYAKRQITWLRTQMR